VEELIETSDLTVTRTSSVAKEALALGVPILLCCWSDFDRSVKTDYIVDEPGWRYCATSEREVVALLNDPEPLNVEARALRDRMFGTKTMADLVSSLLLGPEGDLPQ